MTEGAETTVDGRSLALTARPLAGGGAVVALLDLTASRRLEAVRRDFVANVSHELKTPLTVVGGFAETLTDDDLTPERRRQFAETILANTRRMQRIVDDLLDLSRIESGGWVPKPMVVDTRAAAADAVLPSKALAEDKGVALELFIPDDACTVLADPTALRQVLTNLVENAVRHTPARVGDGHGAPGERPVGHFGWRRIGVAPCRFIPTRCVAYRPRHGGRHRGGASAPHFRAVLPGRSGAFTGGRRDWSRSGDRPASRGGPWGPGPCGQPAGSRHVRRGIFPGSSSLEPSNRGEHCHAIQRIQTVESGS